MTMGKQADKGLVYFMRRADGVGPVKIGCSKWPQERLKALQIWSPETLEIVASAPGTFADETRLHRQFAEYRLHGEWFEASAPVLAAVARAAALGELPPKPANDRNVLIMARFEAGETLQAIGDDLGITRERVRQLVKKEGGKARGQGNRGRTAPVWSQLDTVRRLAASGMGVREIATAIGDNRQNVYVACRASNITVARGKRAMSAATIERAFDIAAQYKAGVLGSEIAAKHGIPQPTIYRYLRIAGVKPKRNDCRCATMPWAEIIEAYRAGETLRSLVGRYGSTSTTISRYIARAGALRTHEENEAIRQEAVRQANRRRQGLASSQGRRMIVRTTNSPRALLHVERGQGEGVILPLSPDNHHTVGRHSPVHSKLSDELREYLRDQPRLVLIGVNGVAHPFFHLPFHSAASSHGEPENNARQY